MLLYFLNTLSFLFYLILSKKDNDGRSSSTGPPFSPLVGDAKLSKPLKISLKSCNC